VQKVGIEFFERTVVARQVYKVQFKDRRRAYKRNI